MEEQDQRGVSVLEYDDNEYAPPSFGINKPSDDDDVEREEMEEG